MTGIWRSDNVLRGLAARPALGPATSFGQNFVAEGNSALQNDVAFLINARVRMAYDDVVDRLNADLPESFALDQMRAGMGHYGNPYGREGRLDETDLDLFGQAVEGVWGLVGETPTERLRRQGVERIFAAIQADPERYGDLPQSHEDLVAPIREAALAARQNAAEISDRAGFWGTVGGWTGAMAASMADPVVAGSMVFGAGAGSGLLRTAMIEGLVGGASELARQPMLAEARRRIGSELTFDEALLNVATASGGAALFGVGFKVAGRGIAASYRRLAPPDLEPRLSALTDRELVEVVNHSYAWAGERARVAAAQMESRLNLREDNPLPDTRGGRTEHLQRADQAEIDLAQMRAPSSPDRPLIEVARPPAAEEQGPIWLFDPRELEREPAVFQYKRDADAAGVNRSLEQVGRWDPIKADAIVVYEYADGRRVVVDAHQRHALALRLLDAGAESDIRMVGHLLRESEGVTPAFARAVGAVKNLAAGTGDAIDAAKVLRDWPNLMDDSLSVGRAWIRQAKEMVNLVDEAFGFIWNDVVPPHYGALVGRLISPEDAALQVAAMKALQETAPANVVQAESVVRSVGSEGAELLQQDSLFGEELVASALIGEKAEVIDAALRRLKRDRSTFQTLVDRRRDIEGAGKNVLDEQTNLEKAQADAIAISLIQRQAHMAGSAANVALREAARRLHAGESARSVVDDFLDAVARAIRAGDFDGDLAGGVGGNARPDAQGAVLPERASPDAADQIDEAQFDAFADVDGEGPTRQREALEADLANQAADAERAAADQAFMRAEVRGILSELQLLDATIARGVAAALEAAERGGRQFKPDEIAFYRQRLDQARTRAGLVGGVERETVTFERLFEEQRFKQYQALRDGPVRTDALSTLYDAEPVVQDLVDALNARGWSLAEGHQGPFAALKKHVTSIGGLASRLVNKELAVVRNYKRANPGARDAAIAELRAEIAAARQTLDDLEPPGAGAEAPGVREDASAAVTEPAQGESATGEAPAGSETLPGFEPVTDADRLSVRDQAPLEGGNEPPDFGLFDLGARGQRDLEDMLVPAEDVLDEIAASDEFMGQLDACRPTK